MGCWNPYISHWSHSLPSAEKNSATPPSQWGTSAPAKWRGVFGGRNCARGAAEEVQVWWKHRSSTRSCSKCETQRPNPDALWHKCGGRGTCKGKPSPPAASKPFSGIAGLACGSHCIPRCPRGFGALSEAPEEIHLSLQAHRAENTPYTANALHLWAAQQLCLPSVISPSTGRVFQSLSLISPPAGAHPVCQTPAPLTEVPGKDISLSSPAAGQQAILHYCFGKIYPECADVSSRTNIWVVAAEGFSGNEGL